MGSPILSKILSENLFSGKTYFCTIASRRPRLLPSPKNQPKVIIGSISQRTARDGNGFEDHDEETTDEEEGFVDETPLQQM